MHHIPILPPLGLMIFIVGLLFLIVQLNHRNDGSELAGWAIFIILAIVSCLMIVQGFARDL